MNDDGKVVSLRSKDIFKAGPKKRIPPAISQVDRRRVPPPSHPMAVAREFVQAVYESDDGQILAHHRGDFFTWVGTHWIDLEVRDIRGRAYRWLEHADYIDDEGEQKPFAPTRRKVDDLVDAIKSVALVSSRLESPAWTADADHPAAEIVSMANGLLHVPSRTILPHTPSFFTHHSLPFKFRTDQEQPLRWLEFLHQLWPDDPSAIDCLQETFGYILGGDTRQQKIFLLVGPKRGGKGTIARVLTGLLGPHNVAAPTLAGLSTNFGIAPLIGKPLAIVSDARLAAKSDGNVVTERLLSISGEDSLTIDRKYRDPWTGRLPTRFIVCTNELPRLNDASGALASRFVLFLLAKSFYGKENPGLTDELLSEAPAIFSWALAGLDRLNARGYFVQPASGKQAIQQLEDLTSPVAAFIRSACEIGSPYQVEVEMLWSGWKKWCDGENRHPGTKAVFGRDLLAAVPTLKRVRLWASGDRVYAYDGLGLREHHNGSDLGLPGLPDDDNSPSSPRTSAMYPPLDADGKF